MILSYKSALEALYFAPMVSPREIATKELLAVTYRVPVGQELYQHKARKLSIKYIKAEIAWYRRANRWDDSIFEHASMWKSCVARDGGINSNYGQYLFEAGGQLVRVIRSLKADPDSRQAVAMILGQHPLHFDKVDTPCTVSMQFLIRDRKLQLIVTMRSQDAIWGAGNDTPFFAFVRDYVADALDLDRGDLTVFAGSFHIYERHFLMLEEILSDDQGWMDYGPIDYGV